MSISWLRWAETRNRVLGEGRGAIAASVLSADFGRMAGDCRDVLGMGVDLLHLDVMDGHFVKNLTMGVDMIRGIRRHLPDVILDVHLMVERPEDYVDAYAEAGADVFTFHAEVEPQGGTGRLLSRIREIGMLAGMAVNPPTAVEALEPWLGQLDLALVMSVNPGRSGQAFMPEVLSKARWLAAKLPWETAIEIDGGISPRTVTQAVDAGVDVLVSASAIFGAADRAAAIDALRKAGKPAR